MGCPARSRSPRSRSSRGPSATVCCGFPSFAASWPSANRSRSASARWRSRPTRRPSPRMASPSRRRSAASPGRSPSRPRWRSPSGSSSSSRSALTSLIKDELGSAFLFWLVEGILRTAIFIGYIVAISRHPGSAARVPVPRRRAQDDLLLRGERPPHARPRRALLAPSPPLRHQLPADRDGAGDLRLRPDRPARVVLARRLAGARHPADRRPLLRGHQVGRPQPPQAPGSAP